MAFYNQNPLISGLNSISNARDNLNNYLSNRINLPGNNKEFIDQAIASGSKLITGYNGEQSLYNPAQDFTKINNVNGITPLNVQNQNKVIDETFKQLNNQKNVIPNINNGNIEAPKIGNFNHSTNASNNPNQMAYVNPNPNQIPLNNGLVQNKYAGSNGILAGPTPFMSQPSTGNTNQNQVLDNNPYSQSGIFGSFKPEIDQYNQNRRDMMDQAFAQQGQDYTNAVNSMVDSGSLRDAVRFSILANQNRRLMQRSDANGQLANKLASQNLNENNQLSQKDLTDQRNNFMDQQRIDNQNNQFQQNYGLEAQRLSNSTQNDNRNYDLANRRQSMLEQGQSYDQAKGTFLTNQQLAQNNFDNQIKSGVYNMQQMEAQPKMVQAQFNKFASDVFNGTSDYGKELNIQFARDALNKYPGINSQQLQDYIMQQKQNVIQASMNNMATPWGQANLMAQAQTPKTDNTQLDVIYDEKGNPKITGGKISMTDAKRMGLVNPSVVGQGQNAMQSGIANFNPNVKGNQF